MYKEWNALQILQSSVFTLEISLSGGVSAVMHLLPLYKQLCHMAPGLVYLNRLRLLAPCQHDTIGTFLRVY